MYETDTSGHQQDKSGHRECVTGVQRARPDLSYWRRPPGRLLVHGRPKIGKSALCAGAPDAVLIATEEGLKVKAAALRPLDRLGMVVSPSKPQAQGTVIPSNGARLR